MWLYFSLGMRNAWLLRTRNGKREASWRMWLLVFLWSLKNPFLLVLRGIVAEILQGHEAKETGVVPTTLHAVTRMCDD